jgi:hypothetical protein
MKASLGLSIAPQLKFHTTSQALYNAVIAKVSRSLTTFKNKQDAFYSIKIGTDSVDACHSSLVQAKYDLDILGEIIIEVQVVNLLLDAMPEEYSAINDKYNLLEKNIDLSEVLKHLLESERTGKDSR